MDAVTLNSPVGATAGRSFPVVGRVDSIHLFRGLAILQVAGLHASHALFLRGLTGPAPERDPVFIAFEVLLHDSTIYFAVISGFLYAHLFARRGYGPFFRGRLLQVALPYLVMTAALTAVQRHHLDGALVGTIGRNLLTGDAWNTLWYIPVVLLLYGASPLIHAAVCRPGWRFVGLALMVAPLLVSRTGTAVSPQSLVYFGGAYACGMALRSSAGDWQAVLPRLAPWAVLLAVATSLGLVLAEARSIDRIGPISLPESLFYGQKLGLTCLFLMLTRHWARHPVPVRDAVLGLLASAAFGIYFLHGPLMRPIAQAIGPYLPHHPPAEIAGIGLILLLGLLGSLAIIALLRTLLGRRSRWVVGA